MHYLANENRNEYENEYSNMGTGSVINNGVGREIGCFCYSLREFFCIIT